MVVRRRNRTSGRAFLRSGLTALLSGDDQVQPQGKGSRLKAEVHQEFSHGVVTDLVPRGAAGRRVRAAVPDVHKLTRARIGLARSIKRPL